MDGILTKYFLGEASEEEIKKVELWLKQDAANTKHYEDIKIIWNEAKYVEIKSKVDENAAWQRFDELLTKNQNSSAEGKVVSIGSGTKNKIRRLIAIAASVIITVGVLGYFLFNKYDVVIVASDKVIEQTLPDGSVVTLNKETTVSYNKSFNKQNRNLALSGEAFFNVTPNKQKPFRIKIDDVEVTVVGTSFNIKSDASGTEVIVESGIVKVNFEGKTSTLKAGEKIKVSKKLNEAQVEKNDDPLYRYYRTNQFVCNNTPLEELTEALNKNYNVHIKILNPATAQMRITTQFDKESLDDILMVISRTLHVEVENNKNGNIIIK